MIPRALEAAVDRFLRAANRQRAVPRGASPGQLVTRLYCRLEIIERRQRRQDMLRILKQCASHLVLEGDEPSDESTK